MTWAATVKAFEGQVVVRLAQGHPPVEMAPDVARTLAATLLVVAERAESGENATEQETETNG
jgi:hypothetical protein